jgi:hypothetical protein
LAHFQNKAAYPFSLSLVANPCHHGRWFSALFSVAALLAAHIAFGDIFSVEKINTRIVQRMASACDFHVGQRLWRLPCQFLRQIQTHWLHILSKWRSAGPNDLVQESFAAGRRHRKDMKATQAPPT